MNKKTQHAIKDPKKEKNKEIKMSAGNPEPSRDNIERKKGALYYIH
jgi:hypothetical protein